MTSSTRTPPRPASPRPTSGKTKRPPVEPALRARRIEVQRDQGRRRLRTLVALFVVTVVVVGGLLLSRSSLADVDAIVVEGAVQTQPEAVVAATGIELGAPLVGLDVEGAARSVAGLPWVASVEVRRRLSGTVVVRIEEREARLALLTAEGRYVRVDADGRQLDYLDARPPEFMPVAGIVASGELGQPAPPATRAVLNTIDALTPELTALVSQVLIDESTLYLELRSGGRVKLGDDSSLAQKIISLETMMANADLRCLWEIDVRVPSAPALRRVSQRGDPTASLTDLSTCT